MSEIPGTALTPMQNEHLDWLEVESIHVIREVVAECCNPAPLFSGSKDSIVMLHLALKAFRLGERKIELSFLLMHISTGHNCPEVITFCDGQAARLSARLAVGHIEDFIKRGTVRLRKETDSRNAARAVMLLETIKSYGFGTLMGSVHRDEEKTRVEERIFSFRDEFGQWDPKTQRPELWGLCNTRMAQGEQMCVFPISNRTGLDVWQYIAHENLALPPIYYTHKREVARRNGLLVPIILVAPEVDSDMSEALSACFRTVGDINHTCPVASTVATSTEIIAEMAVIEITEHGAIYMDDQTSEALVERRKKEKHF